jgi:hypothetical protein
VQDRYGVRFLTYWFDEKRGTGFCLIDAPDSRMASASSSQLVVDEGASFDTEDHMLGETRDLVERAQRQTSLPRGCA